MEHPITPPPELVQQWLNEEDGLTAGHIATQAARWGDDQRLMACCELVKCSGYPALALQMLAAMRPKPPSLKEQALRILVENGTTLDGRVELDRDDTDTILRALEAMTDD